MSDKQPKTKRKPTRRDLTRPLVKSFLHKGYDIRVAESYIRDALAEHYPELAAVPVGYFSLVASRVVGDAWHVALLRAQDELGPQIDRRACSHLRQIAERYFATFVKNRGDRFCQRTLREWRREQRAETSKVVPPDSAGRT